ncbi:MAG: hypothetical protein CMB48_02630 [Euryarchaeota archaeon]|nr:hypothetical protein [Euryarchaeota archaeon]|tara:strand:- start:1328 stop:2488 length:1161 start_codon:yes stop_codon:yes gene_type:complete
MVSAKSNSLNQYIGKKFKSFFLIFLFLSSVIFIDINTVDYGIEGCEKNIVADIDNFNSTDVTFIAFGDSQHWDSTNRQNDYQVEALNHFNEILSWEDAGYEELGEISDIRGVIMAGDITQNGRDGRVFSTDEYGEFIERYGLCGNNELKYPIYEGYGNHDYFEWSNLFYRIPQDHPVIDSVAIRNEYRSNLTNVAPGMDGHYSWEWDNIHFIQLNLAPSDIVPSYEEGGFRNPHNALTFMKNDLDEHVVGTNKKVVLIAHYGPWEWREWDETQITNLCEVIEEYRPYIISYIHGHSHSTKVYDWCEITIFNSGSPYHDDDIHSSYNEDLRGRFTLFRIMENETKDLKLIAVDVSWSSENYLEGDIETLDLQIKEWKGFPHEENITN